MDRQFVQVRRAFDMFVKTGMDSKPVLAQFDARAMTLMYYPNVARVRDAGATLDGRPVFLMG